MVIGMNVLIGACSFGLKIEAKWCQWGIKQHLGTAPKYVCHGCALNAFNA
jgi:hypothetical protein